MNILALQILTLLISAIWFDYFELQTWLKVRMGYMPHVFRKPYDCFTCTNWWFGVIVCTIATTIYLILYGFGWWLVDVPIFLGMNYLLGNLTDHIKYS